MSISTLNITTKLNDEGKTKVVTALTIDWSGISEEQLRDLASAQVVQKYRKEQLTVSDKEFPSEAKINAADYAERQRAARGTGAVSAASKAVSKLTPEQKVELLRMLSEG